jgi:hypothetical protein
VWVRDLEDVAPACDGNAKTVPMVGSTSAWFRDIGSRRAGYQPASTAPPKVASTKAFTSGE